MKRILLFLVCATVMIAANAQSLSQKFHIAPTNGIKFVKSHSMKQQLTGIKSMNVRHTQTNLPTVNSAKKSVAKAEALETKDFSGHWVDEFEEDMTEDLGMTFSVATQDSISSFVESDTTWVEIDGALEGYATSLYGYYEADKGTVTIPAQYCYEHETYGKFIFGGLSEDGQSLEMEYVLDVTTDENGNITLNSDKTWLILMAEGDYKGYSWTEGSSLTINKANYRFYEYESHINDAGTDWTDFAEDSTDVYAEQLDGMIIVHGMFGTSIQMVYNEDTKYYEIPNGQPVSWFRVPDSSQSTGYSFKSYVTYNCDTSSGEYIDIPMNETTFDPQEDYSLNAYISSSKAVVFGTYDETATSGVSWDYIYVARMLSSTGGYFKGLHCGMCALPLSLISGINDIKADAVAGLKNAPAFNLAGQKVGDNFRGIMIRDGKKIVK